MEVLNLSDIRFKDLPTLTIIDENGNEIYVTQPIVVDESFGDTETNSDLMIKWDDVWEKPNFTDWSTKAFTDGSTTDVSEGTNLYWTQARFDTAFTAKSTTDLAEGTNKYYTDARFDTAFGLKNTDALAEGTTNLYFTNARVDSRIALQKGSALGIAPLESGAKHSTT
jgi:hypothetical protein